MGQGHSELRQTRASLFYLITYLFPLATGLLISPTDTFHLLGSRAEHATTAWRLFGGLLLVLAIVVVRLIRKHQSAGVHQYSHWPFSVRSPLQLLGRKDREPSIFADSYRARIRGGVDIDRPRARSSTVDRRTAESEPRIARTV